MSMDRRLPQDLGATQMTSISWRKGRSKLEVLTMARLAGMRGIDAKSAVYDCK